MNSLRTFLSIRKRVRQRATRFSLLVVALLFGLFLEAYMHNFNLVYITLFFVFAAAFAAGPMGVRNLGVLEARFEGCGRLFANREGACSLRIANPSGIASWAIDVRTAVAAASLPEVPAHSVRSVRLHFTPLGRGRLDAGPCTLQSLFPLATVRFVLAAAETCPLIVCPEPKGEPLQNLLMRRRAAFGEENDFSGITPYSGAESPSRIHWPSVAKGEPAVKTFERERPLERLHFEFYRCGATDEERLSQLALWVLECETARLPFTVVMPARTFESRKDGIDAILEYLALYH